MTILASVGQNGANREIDVLKVQTRLAELGFYTSIVDGDCGPKTVRSIRLFQSVTMGLQQIGGDGRIDPGMGTHKWLDAENAPKWVLMPQEGTGYRNVEREDASDKHDYGSSWLANTIALAGASYWALWGAAHRASRIIVNDASLPLGGDTPDHGGHECGMQVDLRPPRKDGKETLGTAYNKPEYDQPAMRAQLRALQRQPLVQSIFFNDPVLIAERLCKHVHGHSDHIHVGLKPPDRS